MMVIDADAHGEENEATFGDQYLDPAFRAQRPRQVALDDTAYWVIEDQLFPRRVGRGAHNLGSPTTVGGERAWFTATKPETLPSIELSTPEARLKDMDAEGIDVAVVYPGLFLVHPLTNNPKLGTALCAAYNRWMSHKLGRHERLRWAAVVNLDDLPGAVGLVREARRLGAAAVMILGTVGDRLLDDPALLPFYEAVAAEDLALAVHVGWSCPSISNLYSDLYVGTVIPFLMPVAMGFAALVASGVLDRLPELRVGFLEAGCEWVHYMVHRLDHRYIFAGLMAKRWPEQALRAARRPLEYIRRGNLYFATEVEDTLLPQVIELVGEGQIVFGSDMLHGDREPFAAKILRERSDLSESSKQQILEANPRRLYRL